MIDAVAVCPHPPGLVPSVGRGLPELDDVRAAAHAAVASLVSAAPRRVVVLGPGADLDLDETAGGSFVPFGVDLAVGGPTRSLPAPFVVGAWLLDEAGWTGPRRYVTAPVQLVEGDVLLVLADGDTRVGVDVVHYGDPRAAALDDLVAAALDAGDAAALAAIDVDLADTWDGTGARPLRELGRLVEAETAKGAAVTARLSCDATPFGIRYWVAEWSLTASRR